MLVFLVNIRLSEGTIGYILHDNKMHLKLEFAKVISSISSSNFANISGNFEIKTDGPFNLYSVH